MILMILLPFSLGVSCFRTVFLFWHGMGRSGVLGWVLQLRGFRFSLFLVSSVNENLELRQLDSLRNFFSETSTQFYFL
jgi:hypothetical protein